MVPKCSPGDADSKYILVCGCHMQTEGTMVRHRLQRQLYIY